MSPVEPNAAVVQQQPQQQPPLQQQQQSQKLKRRSRSNERNSRDNNRQKSRRNSRSRSGDRESSSSSSSSSHNRQGGNGSMDEEEDDDDASVSDRSSQGSPSAKPSANIRWDYRMNLIGKRVKDSKALCCFNCRYPVILVGRLIPCKHAAFCLQCANELKTARRNCPKCNEGISDVEKIDAKNLIVCLYDSHPHSHDACLRGYTSQRDLQAHVKRRHEQPAQPNQPRLDSPHQLIPSVHPPPAPFPVPVVDPQQQPQIQSPLPPPLLPFPPINVPGMAPPPRFDMGFRPPGYGHLPPQQFVPPQGQYRPPPYPPNRPFY